MAYHIALEEHLSDGGVERVRDEEAEREGGAGGLVLRFIRVDVLRVEEVDGLFQRQPPEEGTDEARGVMLDDHDGEEEGERVA